MRVKLHEPFRINHLDLFARVLFRRLHELVVDDPLRLTVEQFAAHRVNVDHLTVYQGTIAPLRIPFCRVPEEARKTDGLLNAGSVPSSRHHVQLVPVHDAEQLFAHGLSTLSVRICTKFSCK